MGRALNQLFKNSRGPNDPDPVNREALRKMFPDWERVNFVRPWDANIRGRSRLRAPSNYIAGEIPWR